MHAEFVRHVPKSEYALLMIHGIAGSPAHFSMLTDLIPPDWSVRNLLLEGHGKTVRDFSAASMKKWKKQVKQVLQQLLSEHKQVVIVAHSMGTLFALQAAADYPGRVKGVLLLAVPLRVRLSIAAVIGGTCLAFNGKSGNKTAMAMAGASSIIHEGKFYQYIGWLPRMAELLIECRRVRKSLPLSGVCGYAFQSGNDELVSQRTVEDLLKQPNLCCHVLEQSGHFTYASEDIKTIQSAFNQLIQ